MKNGKKIGEKNHIPLIPTTVKKTNKNKYINQDRQNTKDEDRTEGKRSPRKKIRAKAPSREAGAEETKGRSRSKGDPGPF